MATITTTPEFTAQVNAQLTGTGFVWTPDGVTRPAGTSTQAETSACIELVWTAHFAGLTTKIADMNVGEAAEFLARAAL